MRDILKYIIIYSVVFLTVVLAVLLSRLPLPQNYKWLMPSWNYLFLIYWVIFLPGVVGIIFSFGVGLIIDLLTGTLLGSTSASLVLISFFADKLSNKFIRFSFSKKILAILVLIGMGQLIRCIIQISIGHPPTNINYWFSIATSVIAWPVVYLALSTYQRIFKIG